MKFEECYAIIKEKYEKADLSKVDKDFSAVLSITGANAGHVFVSYIGKKKIIEPIKHDNASFFVTMSDETFEELMQKRIEPFKAYTSGKVKAKGNIFLAMSIYKKMKK